jgi:hypothetical protein
MKSKLEKEKTKVEVPHYMKKLIYRYAIRMPYKIRDWIQIPINWNKLSENGHIGAIRLLRKNIKKIKWESYGWVENNKESEKLLLENWHNINPLYLSSDMYSPEVFERLTLVNPRLFWDNLCRINKDWAMELLVRNPENIDYYILSINPHDKAIDLLFLDERKICGFMLSQNTNTRAIEFLKRNPRKIHWGFLSKNTNDKAVEYMIRHPDKINWAMFSQNNNDLAVEFMARNSHMLVWRHFSRNTNPRILNLFQQNLDKIDWWELSSNCSDCAIDVLEQNLHRCDEWRISQNTNIRVMTILEQTPKLIRSNIYFNKNIFVANLTKYHRRLNTID